MALVLVFAQAKAAVGPAPVSRPIEDVLVRMVEISRGDAAAPTVTLLLDGGAQVTGTVRDLSGAGRDASIVLEDRDALHYVDARTVLAVTVHDAASLPKGAFAPPARAIAKVDVQRRAEELARLAGDFLGKPLELQIVWKGLPESGDGLAVVPAAIAEAAAGIRDAASDELVRQDLARRLKHVRIVDAPRAGASFSGDTLVIGVAPAAGGIGRPSATEVRRALLAQ